MKAIILTSILGISTLFAGLFNFKNKSVYLVIIGLIAALGLLISDWNHPQTWYNDMLRFDNYAVAFSAIMTAGLILIMGLAISHYKEAGNNIADLYALMVFSLTGAYILVSFSHMAMLFLGVEILSIPLYIMAGSNRAIRTSNESALKYFLMGSFASGFMLFGIALVFGATGSFHIEEIARQAPGIQTPIFTVGVLMILAGFLFKVSAVPFHFWVPDVYEGAPHLVTTFMATIVKTAGFAALYRLFSSAFSIEEWQWFPVLWAMTAATLLVGNLMALIQSKMKRMLAFSSVSHAGYLLLAILTLNKQSGNAIMLYMASYTLATILAFGVLMLVVDKKGNDSFQSFRGLAVKNPFLAACLAIGLLSMAGIPPLAGFFGKYYLFSIALKTNLFWIVITAIVASIIGAWYYLKALSQAYLSPVENELTEIEVSFSTKLVLGLCIIGTIVLGIMPNLIIGL
jgi:NADH-quinone oxidoreductase subunit N